MRTPNFQMCVRRGVKRICPAAVVFITNQMLQHEYDVMNMRYSSTKRINLEDFPLVDDAGLAEVVKLHPNVLNVFTST